MLAVSSVKEMQQLERWWWKRSPQRGKESQLRRDLGDYDSQRSDSLGQKVTQGGI